MAEKTEKRPAQLTLLPDLLDWFDVEFPVLFPAARTAPALHGIRIEEQLTDDAYRLSAELPGIDPEHDVEISVAGDILTLRAERGQSSRGKHRSEFRYGAFARSVRLPAGARADDATADYTDGILTVTVPVSGPKAASRTIKVKQSKG